MIYFVHLPCFSNALAAEFPEHCRITETLYAIDYEPGDVEELANRIGLHFEEGVRTLVMDVADVSWRLPESVSDEFEAWRIERQTQDGDAE